MCTRCALLSVFQDSFLLLCGLISQAEVMGGGNQQKNILTCYIYFYHMRCSTSLKCYYSLFIIDLHYCAVCYSFNLSTVVPPQKQKALSLLRSLFSLHWHFQLVRWLPASQSGHVAASLQSLLCGPLLTRCNNIFFKKKKGHCLNLL